MDELRRLREFRSDVVVPSGSHARAREALAAAIGGRRRRRSRLLLAVAAALLLLGGGTAYALAREFLVGEPAPNDVRERVALLNAVKGELIPRTRRGVRIRADETRLAATIRASTGRVYLWVAPAAAGDYCFLQIVGTELPDGGPNLGGGGCGAASGPVAGTRSGSRVRGRWLTLVHGQVRPTVERLVAVYKGRRLPIRLTGRFFLAELPGIRDSEAPQLTLVAYDAAGREVGRQPFGRVLPRPRPVDVTRERPLLEILTRRTRKPIRLYVADGCEVLVTPGGTSSGCGGRALRPREIPIGTTQIGAAPRGMLLLWGEVGRAIARLELRFEDGRVERLPLVRQYTLYQVAPRDFAAGRRPVELVGRNAAGKVVGRRSLGPWAG
jgi:hypothetical protein